MAAFSATGLSDATTRLLEQEFATEIIVDVRYCGRVVEREFPSLRHQMPLAKLAQIQPILGTRDLARAVTFYVDRLGFRLAFGDPSVEVGYVGMRRDHVEVHMQFQYDHEMSTTRLRFVVDDPDALFEEWNDKNVFHEGTRLRDTSWNTREFAFYDLDHNGLTFYRHLK